MIKQEYNMFGERVNEVRSVLMAIKPYYVFLIIAHAMGWNIPQEKTVEVRKNFPKLPNWDKSVIIYCSRSKRSFKRIPKEYQPLMVPLLGKVIGEFVCDWIRETKHVRRTEAKTWTAMFVGAWTRDEGDDCLTYGELLRYLGIGVGYGWHISDLKIYDQPKELWEFHAPCMHSCLNCVDPLYDEGVCEEHGIKRLTAPPQSWYYISR